MIPIVNIDSDTIYESLYQQLLSQPSITGIEETHLTYTSEKWLILTTKKTKNQAQRDIDSLIPNSEILSSIEHPPGRYFTSYVTMLQ